MKAWELDDMDKGVESGMSGKTLRLNGNTADEERVQALKALASLPRWRILEALSGGGRSVGEVAQLLGMPPSTAAAQIKILEAANFLHSELLPASHGLQKICTRTYDDLLLELPRAEAPQGHSLEATMPIGAYTAFEAAPTCGLASPEGLIGFLDDPLSFYEAGRVGAGLLWFRSGYVEYTFPSRLPVSARLQRLVVSAEVCSEAPLSNHDWPSDLTLWVNGVEIGTWTCPADFGGQRGQLTPQWWNSGDSQYGVLKRWLVSDEGSFIDGHPLSGVTAAQLELTKSRVVTVRLGVRPDALHAGGMNLFGHTFGNYPQDLTLRLDYLPKPRSDELTREPRRGGDAPGA